MQAPCIDADPDIDKYLKKRTGQNQNKRNRSVVLWILMVHQTYVSDKKILDLVMKQTTMHQEDDPAP